MLAMHLPVRRALQEREGDYPEQASSEHGLFPLEGADHLNATFIPATKVRGEPA
jgi:hypothetical protein